ncbi:MAG TPA: MFS transporter [Capsulimonadaceae bacterium]
MQQIGLPQTTRSAGPFSDRRTLGIVLAGFCTFLDLYTTQALLPLFRTVFHASEVAVSLTVSATTLAVAFSAPIVGLVADRMGRKRVIVAATFALAVPTLLAATSTSLTALVFWRFVQGIFLPGIFSVSMAYIAEEYGPTGGAGKAMSAYITGNVVGGFMGRFLSGLFATHLGWRWAFVLIGLLNLLGAVAVARLLPLAKNFVPVTSWRTSIASFGLHLRNKQLLATYAVGFNVLFAQVATFTYVCFYLAAKPFGLSAAALGSLFFVYLLGVFITPLSGRAIDRWGYRRVLVGGVTASCVGILIALSHILWVEIVALAISSSGVFISQVAGSSHVGAVAKTARSSASGLYVMCYYLGGSFGGVVPGYLWATGGWPACVALIVFVQLVTVSLALAFWADKPQPKAVLSEDDAVVLATEEGETRIL